LPAKGDSLFAQVIDAKDFHWSTPFLLELSADAFGVAPSAGDESSSRFDGLQIDKPLFGVEICKSAADILRQIFSKELFGGATDALTGELSVIFLT